MPKFSTLKLQTQHLVTLSFIKIVSLSYHGKNSVIKNQSVDQFKVLRNEIVSILNVVDFTNLINRKTLYRIISLINSNDKILCKVQETDKKELYNLGFFEHDKGFNDPNQVLINFSSYQLSDGEKLLLAKELNFALPPKILNRVDYLLPFEMVY